MVSNPRSIKKIDEPVAEEKSIVDSLLANAFEKGNPDICMRCQSDIRGGARVSDAHSLHAVCFKCLTLESHMEFADVDDEVWIPFNDALIFDKNGRDITSLVRQKAEQELNPVHIKIFKVMDGEIFQPSLPPPSEVGEDKMIELRSLLAAIDMAIDLGYKDDFLELSAKYKKLLQEGELDGF